MSTKPVEQGQDVIPDVLVDSTTKKKYQRGKFLGKVSNQFLVWVLLFQDLSGVVFQGGFAKCFELTEVGGSGTIYAGKIVSKQLLVKPHQKDKMAQEISIHKSLSHKHVVGFYSFFEDSNFVYIVLELCKRRVSSDCQCLVKVGC